MTLLKYINYIPIYNDREGTMKTKSFLLRACVCGTLLSAFYISAFAAEINDEETATMGEHQVTISTSNWMQQTDVGVKFQQNHKPQYSIETLQPITHFDENSKSLVFIQGRVERPGGESFSTFNTAHFGMPFIVVGERTSYSTGHIGTVGSLGVGYRHLSPGEHSYVGVNVFYDHAFKEHHNRTSIGTEYVLNENKIYTNICTGQSAIKTTYERNFTADIPHWGGDPDHDVIVYQYGHEKVANGYTIGYERTFKNARWVTPYVEYYHWKLNGWTDDKHPERVITNERTITGLKWGMDMQLTPHVSLDFGLDKARHRSGEGYVQVMYTLGKKPFALWGGQHSDNSMSIARAKMLDKVKRHTMMVNRVDIDGNQHVAHANQL